MPNKQLNSDELQKLSKGDLKDYLKTNGWFTHGTKVWHIHINNFDPATVDWDITNRFFRTGNGITNHISVNDIPVGGDIVFVEAIYSVNFPVWEVSRNGYAMEQSGLVANNMPYVTMDHDAITRWQLGKVISTWLDEDGNTRGTHYYNGDYIKPKDEARRNQLRDGLYEQFSTAHITLKDGFRNNTTGEIISMEELVNSDKTQQEIFDIAYNPVEYSYHVLEWDFLHISPVDVASNSGATAINAKPLSFAWIAKTFDAFDVNFLRDKVMTNSISPTAMWILSKVSQDEELNNVLKEKKTEIKDNNSTEESQSDEVKTQDNVLDGEDGLNDQLNELLDDRITEGHYYVVEIFESEFVYNHYFYGNNDDDSYDIFYRQGYTYDDGVASLTGEPVEVERETQRVDLVNAYRAWLNKEMEASGKPSLNIEELENTLRTKIEDEMKNAQKSLEASINKALENKLAGLDESIKTETELKESNANLVESNKALETKSNELIAEVQGKIKELNTLERIIATSTTLNSKMEKALEKFSGYANKLVNIANTVKSWVLLMNSGISDMKSIKRSYNKSASKKGKSYMKNLEIESNEFATDVDDLMKRDYSF